MITGAGLRLTSRRSGGEFGEHGRECMPAPIRASRAGVAAGFALTPEVVAVLEGEAGRVSECLETRPATPAGAELL